MRYTYIMYYVRGRRSSQGPASDAMHAVQSNERLQRFFGDTNGDGRVTLRDSKIAISRFAKKHAGFSAGFLGGAFAGMRL